MRFDKLQVNGFKSFGDKTEFDFDDGITCIVGPNGCGKSNVVDAVQWVLGEQSSKTLRGGAMEDVIFHGSGSRQPSGAASVTLVFDNSDGRLKPVGDIPEDENFDEIAITRRLYRSGRSEYLINGSAVRLRDIKEMLLDTGIGSSGYSIVKQGRISSLLQASTEERRQFFDEAAGICLYKARKKEAMRKLDRVEQNLFRLTDIIGEVEKRLRSIKYQAGKARSYEKYSGELQELKALYFLSSYHLQREELATFQCKCDSEKEVLVSLREELKQLESVRQDTENELHRLQACLDERRAAEANLDSRISVLRERIELQTSSRESLSQQIEKNRAKSEAMDVKIAEVTSSLDRCRAELGGIHEEVNRLEGLCEEMREKKDSHRSQLTAVSTKIEEETNHAVEIARSIELIQAEMHDIVVKKNTMFPERDRLQSRQKELDEERIVCSRRREIFSARQKQIAKNVAAVETHLEEVKAESVETTDDANNLMRSISEAREERSSLQGKINTLKEMQSHFEGLDEGTRKLLEARDEGKLDVICGLLGNYIDTDVENAGVVEAALSGAERMLIAPSFASVQQSAEQIKEIVGEQGAVNIMCLDQIDSHASASLPEMIPSAKCRMLDVVRFEPWLSPLMHHLAF